MITMMRTIRVSGMKERSKLIEMGVNKEVTNRLSEREASRLLRALLLMRYSYPVSMPKEILLAA